MHLSHDPDDRRPAQRARVRQEFGRAIERLQGDQIPDYVILRSLVAICRKIHRRTEADDHLPGRVAGERRHDQHKPRA